MPKNTQGDCTNTEAGYGDILYGAQGDDDDCKYHVSWVSNAVTKNQNVTFTVTVTKKTDGKPVTGANPYVEAFFPCDRSHPPPGVASNPAKELSPGVYTVGPVQFDQPGHWAVRFHFSAECNNDAPESPHGHAAFYVIVP